MNAQANAEATFPNGLSKPALSRAIKHLQTLGDSDIVPPLPEYLFFAETADEITELCSKLTVGSYQPKSAVQLLSPKSEFGYRIAHQLTAFDNLAYLSAAIACAAAIEEHRPDDETGRAYAYRFTGDGDHLLFRRDRSFHDWLTFNADKASLRNRLKGIGWVVLTDISDFYHRIYQHRIANSLDQYTDHGKAQHLLIKTLKKIQAEQSYGLPVGSSGSRIVAEAVLIDTDEFIQREDWDATRFVDDIRMFFKSRADAETALGRLAQHLMVTEGLSLNASKSRIMSISDYASFIRSMTEDVFSREESEELEQRFRLEYGEDEPIEFEDDGFDANDVLQKLREVVESGLEVSRLKAALRALRVYPLLDVPSFIEEFGELFRIVPRDMSLAILAGIQDSPLFLDSEEPTTRDSLLELLTSEPYSELPILRIWILEVFARGALKPTKAVLKAVSQEELTVIERRQLLLIKAHLNDVAYFRTLKTRFSELSDWEKPMAMWAASCLPSDEYEKWITFAKGLLNEPYADLYAKWLIANQAKLLTRLATTDPADELAIETST